MGEILRMHRKGMSQGAIARRLGLSQQNVSQRLRRHLDPGWRLGRNRWWKAYRKERDENASHVPLPGCLDPAPGHPTG